MIFKEDKNLICDACGHPVRWSILIGDKISNAFTCSNLNCRHSVTYESAIEGELPEFVVVKKGVKNEV
jgi:hypothetical protein